MLSPATCGRELNHNKSGLPTCSGLGKPYRHRPSELAKWSVVKKLLITADVVVGGGRGSLLVESEWWSRHGHATKKQRDYESNILTTDEAREYCRFVGQGIEMARCQTSFIVCKLWTSLCGQHALRTTTSGCGADGGGTPSLLGERASRPFHGRSMCGPCNGRDVRCPS